MNAEQLNQALYDKMEAEQERFKHNLLGLSTEEALNHAYEYAMRQDILAEMEALELPADRAAALLASPTPMADVYRQWGKVETHHMEDIRDVIEELAGSMLETQREATRAIPLYQENARYAKEHGEIELFRASQEANIACRDAIDTAIQEGYDGLHLHADVKGVLAEFGPERVSHVLAATLLDKTWDQRISRDNQAWAASVPMSAYIRKMCIDGYIINLQIKELDECAKLLRYTSNNVNQIARRVNAGGGVYPDEVDEITAKLTEASGLFGSILEQLSKIK